MRATSDAWTWATGLVLGIVVAALLPRTQGRKKAGAVPRIRAFVWLMGGFLWELLLSNWKQLRLVLSPKLELRPVWLRFDSRLETPTARAILGTMISMTPGTITASIDEDGPGSFCIHVLDERDEEQCVRRIRSLFEDPLLVLEGKARSAAPDAGENV
jgi:multicomponent K+:H+ antiporter subunit E